MLELPKKDLEPGFHVYGRNAVMVAASLNAAVPHESVS